MHIAKLGASLFGVLLVAGCTGNSNNGSNSQVNHLQGTVAALSGALTSVAANEGTPGSVATPLLQPSPSATATPPIPPVPASPSVPKASGANGLPLNLHSVVDTSSYTVPGYYTPPGFDATVDVHEVFHLKGGGYNVALSVTLRTGQYLTADMTICCSKIGVAGGGSYQASLSSEGPDSLAPGGTGQYLLKFSVPETATLEALMLATGASSKKVAISLGSIPLASVPAIDPSELPAVN